MRRTLLYVLGALFVALSLTISFAWAYYFVPMRHIRDQDWLATHSEYEIWSEYQKSIDRIGLTHDDGFAVGHWGDEAWVATIMEEMEPGDNLGCGAGHIDSALAKMTNQTDNANAEAWLAWWEENLGGTQLEWVRDGFADAGIELGDELTLDEAHALLRLLATEADDRGALRYNAFRWLRDHDFRPLTYTIEELVPDGDETVFRGLLVYYELGFYHPGLGSLVPVPPRIDSAEFYGWWMQRWTPYAVWGGAVVSFLVGCLFLVWARRKRQGSASP